MKLIVSWKIDPAYGGGTKIFKGKVTEYDGKWLSIMDKDKQVLHISKTLLHSADKL